MGPATKSLALFALTLCGCSGVEVERHESGGELTILAKSKTAYVELPCEWVSSMAFAPLPEGFQQESDRIVFAGPKIRDDIWRMDEREFEQVLVELGGDGGEQVVQLPKELGLLLRWTPEDEVVERVNPAHHRGMTPLDYSIHQTIPVGLEQPGESRTLENRYISLWSFLNELPPPREGSEFRIPTRAEPVGLGFLEVRARDGATFAAGGTRKEGPSLTREAWFYAAVDVDGAVWMWFEED